MNPSKPTTPSQPNRWRILRRCLVGLGVCLTLICIFYTEELWRGKSAWENCKHALEAKGVDFNWADKIPAPVPDAENVFGVPEMQEWFTGRGARALSGKLAYPDIQLGANSSRMVVAELTIGLPGTPAPAGPVALRWDDPASGTEAARLLTNAVGPTTMAPQSPYGLGIMLRRREAIQPARIFLQCQTAPTEQQIEQFLPDSIFNVRTDAPGRAIKFESNGADSYRVTLPVLVSATNYTAWCDGLEPEFTLIRQALQRPRAQMLGNYSAPDLVPIPNFVLVRSFVQTLGARAECNYLLSRPEEALRDLTLMHDLCRPVMEENKVMTLVSAMINGAVRGLYANLIDDGLRFHVWREPQLAALEAQLRQVNILVAVKEAFDFEREATVYNLETMTGLRLLTDLVLNGPTPKEGSWEARRVSVLGGLMPRGWIYQNLVTHVTLSDEILSGMDPANQSISPDKIAIYLKQLDAIKGHWSPGTFIAKKTGPNFKRALQMTAHHQTMINQTRIVCALERHHLAHGEYPETLAALTPQFLDKIPRDVIGGQPPHYHRAADGTFVLYLIGWTGRDNGGVRGKSDADGDWVWPEQ